MGTTGYVMSGGTVYDPRSSPTGDLASYYEWDSLDPSYGHSDNSYQYHYHAVSNGRLIDRGTVEISSLKFEPICKRQGFLDCILVYIIN